MVWPDGPDGDALVPEPALRFGDWIEHGHALGHPTFDDLEYHLTTLFPPVRPRGWLELRMIDALPDECWPVAVAVATALLDHPDAVAATDEAVTSLRGRWAPAARDGLADPATRAAAEHCFARDRRGVARPRCVRRPRRRARRLPAPLRGPRTFARPRHARRTRRGQWGHDVTATPAADTEVDDDTVIAVLDRGADPHAHAARSDPRRPTSSGRCRR